MKTNNHSIATDTLAEDFHNVECINFDSKDEAAIEIPNEAEQATDIVIMRAVSPSLLIYKSSWRVEGKVNRSVVFGDGVQEVLKGAVSSRVRDDLDGMVIQPEGASNAILFKKSNILTYIAMLAEIKKGLENVRYSAFYRKPRQINLLNSEGYMIKSSKQALIVSVESVNDMEKTDQGFDVFSYLEKNYVFKLRADGIVHKHRAERLSEKLKQVIEAQKNNTGRNHESVH